MYVSDPETGPGFLAVQTRTTTCAMTTNKSPAAPDCICYIPHKTEQNAVTPFVLVTWSMKPHECLYQRTWDALVWFPDSVVYTSEFGCLCSQSWELRLHYYLSNLLPTAIPRRPTRTLSHTYLCNLFNLYFVSPPTGPDSHSSSAILPFSPVLSHIHLSVLFIPLRRESFWLLAPMC